MTVSIKVHVNGNYRATIKQSVDGALIDTIVVEPQEEKQVFFRHGVENTLVMTEEYLGERVKPVEDDPNAAITTSKA